MSTIIEMTGGASLSFSQRWNNYLTLILAAAIFVIGITLRNNALNATQTFEDLEAGVRAQMPHDWLLSTQSDEFVIRTEDPDALPFKTLLQISIQTIGSDMTPNLILDLLNMQRAPRFSTYTEISRNDITLNNDPAKRMTYAYTYAERNPFQASVPLVIQGVDVVVLRRSQAIVITYREERSAFAANLYHFENLLGTVEIF